jgi:hypothetical protein
MTRKNILTTLTGALLLALPLSAAARRRAWPPETISGTIRLVDPARNLVVMQDASGVPFDLLVTRSTRIRSGPRKLTLRDLAGKANRKVEVRFVPQRKGDVARSIQLIG